jgi:hypothetical protein
MIRDRHARDMVAIICRVKGLPVQSNGHDRGPREEIAGAEEGVGPKVAHRTG